MRWAGWSDALAGIKGYELELYKLQPHGDKLAHHGAPIRGSLGADNNSFDTNLVDAGRNHVLHQWQNTLKFKIAAQRNLKMCVVDGMGRFYRCENQTRGPQITSFAACSTHNLQLNYSFQSHIINMSPKNIRCQYLQCA